MCEIAFHTASQATVVGALLPTMEPNYNAQLTTYSFLTENRAEKTHISMPKCGMISVLLSLTAPCFPSGTCSSCFDVWDKMMDHMDPEMPQAQDQPRPLDHIYENQEKY